MEDRKTNLPDRRPPSIEREKGPLDDIVVILSIALAIGVLYLIFFKS